jgi:hypothetical protein
MYQIQFRKGKENMMENALFRSIRRTCELKVVEKTINNKTRSLRAIFIVILAWYERVMDTCDNGQ